MRTQFPVWPLLTAILLSGNLALAASAQHRHVSPYAGETGREIKSLSSQEIDDLQHGRGLGMAKAAELNGLPGPRHLLDMADELQLDNGQRRRLEALFADMNAEARALGADLIVQERALNEAFANGSITPERLRSLTEEIGRTHATLRYVHLATHLKTPAILTSAQVTHYNRLRGYAADEPCPGGAHKHDHC